MNCIIDFSLVLFVLVIQANCVIVAHETVESRLERLEVDFVQTKRELETTRTDLNDTRDKLQVSNTKISELEQQCHYGMYAFVTFANFDKMFY